MLVAVVAGYLLIPVDEGRISQANCDKIQIGWTRSQVEDFLGKPDLYGILDDKPMLIWEGEDDDSHSTQIIVAFSSQPIESVCFKEHRHGSYIEVVMRRLQGRVRALWP